MKHWTLAVCDIDEGYIHRFTNYLYEREKVPFLVKAFSSVEQLITYGETNRIDLLLITEEALHIGIPTLKVNYIIILAANQKKESFLYEKSIFKYQSIKRIIEELLWFYTEQTGIKTDLKTNLVTEFIGVYSPVSRGLNSSFAITLGQILSEKKKVLYINLEGYSGLDRSEAENRKYSLTDYIYVLLENGKNQENLLSEITLSMGAMDYLSPVRSPLELQCISNKEWSQFFQKIKFKNAYEIVIFDIGEGMNGFIECLSVCEKIYTSYDTDTVSVNKMIQYEEMLLSIGEEEILERTKKIKFPAFRGLEYGPGKYRNGELGRYIENLI